MPTELATERFVLTREEFADTAWLADLFTARGDGTTHQGVPGDLLPYPRPPREDIDALVRSYLGPMRRAGLQLRPAGTPDGEAEVMRAAGYRGPVRLQVGGGQIHERTEDQAVASVFSLSSAAPHLFDDRLAAFEQDL